MPAISAPLPVPASVAAKRDHLQAGLFTSPTTGRGRSQCPKAPAPSPTARLPWCAGSRGRSAAPAQKRTGHHHPDTSCPVTAFLVASPHVAGPWPRSKMPAARSPFVGIARIRSWGRRSACQLSRPLSLSSRHRVARHSVRSSSLDHVADTFHVAWRQRRPPRAESPGMHGPNVVASAQVKAAIRPRCPAHRPHCGRGPCSPRHAAARHSPRRRGWAVGAGTAAVIRRFTAQALVPRFIPGLAVAL